MCERCEQAEESGPDAVADVDCTDVAHTCPECGEAAAYIGAASPNPESGDVLSCERCGYEETW